ncbi:MAG: ATP-binding protein [Thermoplasmata archaeon]|nr:ATP-binding protein [Thermoplasmata archaeon]
MKILELEISEFRGIRHLTLLPKGRNTLIHGPNAAGKSAVIDAVDFLLTGGISRLGGEGSRGLSVRKHGKNVEATIADSWVRGLFELPISGAVVELTRRLDDPEKLTYEPKYEPELAPVLRLAAQGQHLLTRRVLLQFILAEGKGRAQLIQKLLNADDLEELRLSVQRVGTILESDLSKRVEAQKDAMRQIAAMASLPAFSSESLLASVNGLRSELKGPPLQDLKSHDFKTGVVPPTNTPGFSVGTGPIQSRVAAALLSQLGSTEVRDAGIEDGRIRAKVQEITRDSESLRLLKSESLIRSGLDLLDGGLRCPLCETTWAPGRLESHLRHRLELAVKTRGIRDEVELLTKPLQDRVAKAVADLRVLIQASITETAGSQSGLLELWKHRLVHLQDLLSSPLAGYVESDLSPPEVSRLCAPPGAEAVLAAIESRAAGAVQKLPPSLVAWDSLTKIESAWQVFGRGETEHTRCRKSAESWELVSSQFEAQRAGRLNSLYGEVAARFVALYSQLHPEDGAPLRASLTQQKTSAVLTVDFHGKGEVPPVAFHSEGHQDSMGLCMFLALSERIATGKLNFAMLDDVVMSIDADHRRAVAELISQFVGRRQFILTTHDDVWARQLRVAGVVDTGNVIRIRSWSLQGGPVTQIEPEFWTEIGSKIRSGDVPEAAAVLRRNLEAFFAELCAALEAPIIYRGGHQWDVGEYVPAAFSRWNALVEEGRKAALKRGDAAEEARLKALQKTVSDLFQTAQVEQWGINAALHFNNWASLTAGDFSPIADAFRGLTNTFLCGKCSSMVSITRAGSAKHSVACRCGGCGWVLS